jgi:predicted amidohydrolase
MFLAACIQLCCNEDTQNNLGRATALIRRAASNGAKLIVTPENTPYLGAQFHKVELAESIDGETISGFRTLANELQVHLLIGSFAEQRVDAAGQLDTDRCYNTSVLIGPDGSIITRYRKIHLFDVDVTGGLSVKESDSIAPGQEIVVASTELGEIGMSICYDLRFPELFQAQVRRGAQILMVPSAFTLTTGKDHWHALLRARAIENGAYVMAAAQWGTHDAAGKRKSYGHSLIIDPWGIVVGEAGDGETICYAEIDLELVDSVRGSIPVQQNRRLTWKDIEG